MKNNMWQPSTSLAALIARANLLKTIRDFFALREVLEVETPSIAPYAVSDLYIDAIEVKLKAYQGREFFLQTSPEYAMKRLVAAHKVSMYQITKAFRDECSGIRHNPEFSMLEFYRINFSQFELMRELADLLAEVLVLEPAVFISYQEVFFKFLDIDPLSADLDSLRSCLVKHNIDLIANDLSHDDYLSLIFASLIEPKLQGNFAWMIYDFPLSQAALAQVNAQDPRVAHRFEVYIAGLELANGYQELSCPMEHLRRFNLDNALRQKRALPKMAIDPEFIAALEHLPACSGVALGLDRLLMLKINTENIKDVISFQLK